MSLCDGDENEKEKERRRRKRRTSLIVNIALMLHYCLINSDV